MNPPGIFVVGTDTGVGKTHVASLLIRSLRGRGRKVGALKLVATGAKRNTQGELTADDTETLLAALGEPREPLRHSDPLRDSARPLRRRACRRDSPCRERASNGPGRGAGVVERPGGGHGGGRGGGLALSLGRGNDGG